MLAAALLCTFAFQDPDLHTAARVGDVALVRELLAAGVDVNERVPRSGELPLHLATDLEMMEVLLDAGSEVGNSDRSWKAGSPLHRAVIANDRERIELLLEHGADPDARPGPMDVSPLVAAVWEGRSAIVERLLEAGGSLETHVGVCGLVYLAAIRGHRSLARRLFGAGAPVDLPTLCALDDTELALAWLDRDPYSISRLGPELRRTPLHWAALFGSGALVRALIQRGAEVDYRAPSLEVHSPGGSLGWPGPCGLLRMQHGVDPHAGFSTSRGDTPLHDAARVGNRGVVRTLLDEGATVDAFTEHGVTPLALAAEAGAVEVVRDLLAAGADPNAYAAPTEPYLRFLADPHGMRPLDGALLSGLHRPGTIGLDLAGGAPEPDSREAIDRSVELGRLLISAGATPDFQEACALGETEVVREMLKTDPSLATQEIYWRGFRPLDLAARGGHVEIGRLLLAYGAPRTPPEPPSPILRGGLSRTPLEIARCYGRKGFVHMLHE